MSMIWIAILALVAGPDGRSAVGRPAEPRPSIVGGLRPVERALVQSITHPRRAHRSPCSSPWAVSGIDEFDTEEVDETWFLQLDVAGWFAADWSAWGPPRSTPGLDL